MQVLWRSLLSMGASQHVQVQYLGLDPRCLDGGPCPAVMVLCVTLWVWHSSEIASPKNAFGGMGDPKVWLIHTVEEVPGSSGGFASAPAWQGQSWSCIQMLLDQLQANTNRLGFWPCKGRLSASPGNSALAETSCSSVVSVTRQSLFGC